MPGWTDRLHEMLNPRDCDCPTDRDCTCDAIRGRDTDFEDTFRYEYRDGPAESVRGKWWLGGRCSLSCGDVECPPCQREELHEADQLPPASMPWLNGKPTVSDDVAAARAQQERFDKATRPNTKPWHERTPREEAINDAKMNVRVARSIRQERQELGDNRDNGEAKVLTDAARLRQRAQPPTKQNTTDRHSGATMSSAVSYDSLKARLIGIDYAGTQGMLQQALQSIEQLNAELAGVAEGGGAGVQEALGMLQQAQQSAEEANQALGAAQQSTESAAAQLSS
jgi:hypothetical protein